MEVTSGELLRYAQYMCTTMSIMITTAYISSLPSSSGGTGPDSDAPLLPKRLKKREFMTSPVF